MNSPGPAAIFRQAVPIGLLVSVPAAALALFVFLRMDPSLLEIPSGNDVWFEGDLPTVFQNLVTRWSDQTRNANHPLFPLFGTVPVYGLRAIGLDRFAAVSVLIAAVAGAWAGMLYVTLRVSGLAQLDAVIFAAAGASTAAALFWLPVPESAAMASLTLLVVLTAAAMADRGRLPMFAEVAASALTLSVTVTNWLGGLILSFVRRPIWQALQLSVNAFAVVVLLWAVQRAFVPSADFFIGYADHDKYLMQPDAGGPGRVLTVLFVHSAVMPAIGTRLEPKWGEVMSVQHSAPGGGAAALAGSVAWLGLLMLGTASLRRTSPVLRAVVLGSLCGQVALHLVYGEETFLYTLSIVPLLIVVAASGARTSARPVALALAIVFIGTAGWNNGQQLGRALDFLRNHRTVSNAETTELAEPTPAGSLRPR